MISSKETIELFALKKQVREIAHELNSPIQAIMNWAELLKLKAQPGSEIDELVEQVKEEVRRSGILVHHFFRFAREIEEEQPDSPPAASIYEIEITLRRILMKRNLNLIINVTPGYENQHVQCDNTQFLQSLLIFIAAKAPLQPSSPGRDEPTPCFIEVGERISLHCSLFDMSAGFIDELNQICSNESMNCFFDEQVAFTYFIA